MHPTHTLLTVFGNSLDWSWCLHVTVLRGILSLLLYINAPVPKWKGESHCDTEGDRAEWRHKTSYLIVLKLVNSQSHLLPIWSSFPISALCCSLPLSWVFRFFCKETTVPGDFPLTFSSPRLLSGSPYTRRTEVPLGPRGHTGGVRAAGGGTRHFSDFSSAGEDALHCFSSVNIEATETSWASCETSGK